MQFNTIARISLVFSFIAGYADTSTYLAAGGLFSSHITGNIVILAYDLVKHQYNNTLVKLIAFPVFILAVSISIFIASKNNTSKRKMNKLVITEGLILLAAGTIYALGDLHLIAIPVSLRDYALPMLIVFALGLQNAYNRSFSNEVYAPTTVMTINVTQLVLDSTMYLFYPTFYALPERRSRISQILVVVGPFLAGCIAGGIITAHYGLKSVLIIGLISLLALEK